MDITKYAIAKKLFGGGKRTGTAIPVGQPVERIYFNLSASALEVNECLAQLTYTDTGLYRTIAYIIYAWVDPNKSGFEGEFLFALKLEDGSYSICYSNDILDPDATIVLYHEKWEHNRAIVNNTIMYSVVGALFTYESSVTEMLGIPVGIENEKIKNIISVTPF